jgi:hypothetical protein
MIASRNTGTQDLITNGKDGFIVPIRDSDVLAGQASAGWVWTLQALKPAG